MTFNEFMALDSTWKRAAKHIEKMKHQPHIHTWHTVKSRNVVFKECITCGKETWTKLGR